MAEVPEKTDDSAEKAYAAAVAAVKPEKVPGPVSPPLAKADVPVAKAPEKAKTKAAKRATKKTAKPVAAKPVAPPVMARKPKVKRVAKVSATPAPKASAAIKITPPKPTITELKEKIMATAKTTDFSKPISEALGEFQARAKVAYEKSTEAVGEATDFAKGNVEALVESGKILAGGVQDLGKTYVDEAKSAYETFTADLKELAAVKSPTELFQLQGKIARRNFDAFVATSAKNSEAVMKLTNEAFVPISGRVNLAAEKLSKAA